MKISNKNKDKMLIVGILFCLFWLLSGLIFWVTTLFAEPTLTDKEALNKAYNEQQIYSEIRYLQMWEFTEKMTDEEWEKTFLRG